MKVSELIKTLLIVDQDSEIRLLLKGWDGHSCYGPFEEVTLRLPERGAGSVYNTGVVIPVEFDDFDLEWLRDEVRRPGSAAPRHRATDE